MADVADRGELLTALTTEHFTLQGARSQTMSESSSRAALYIGAVSSTLVALGFLGQLSPGGDTFNTFALTVLPTLYVLGVFTFVRLVECGAEDFRYGLAINRIRGYYKQLAGGPGRPVPAVRPRRRARRVRQRGGARRGAHPVLHLRERGGRDQQRGSVAVRSRSRSTPSPDASLGVAAGAGVAVATISVIALLRFAARLLDARTGGVKPLFPSQSRAARRAPTSAVVPIVE